MRQNVFTRWPKLIKDNLLVQFSVVSFVITTVVAVDVAVVLSKKIELNAVDTFIAGAGDDGSGRAQMETYQDHEPLAQQINELRHWSFASIGAGFVVLYGSLVTLVWHSWRTINRQERYVLAVRGANDGLWDWNLKTNEVYFSPHWKSMLGYEEKEINNTLDAWFSRVHPEDIGQLKAAIAAHLQGLTPHFEAEHRILHKQETYYWMLSRGTAVGTDGQVCRIVGSQTDISKRKQAEATLLATQERLQYLVSSNPAIIYSRKPTSNYGITFISENVALQLGYQSQEFTEDSSFWVDRVHPQDLPHVLTEFSHSCEQESQTCEYRFQHQDGTYRWIQDKLKLVRDQAGNPLELLGCWQDITAAKQLETEHKQAAAALQQAEAKYRSIFENATEGIFQTTADGHYLTANPMLAQIYGYDSPAELITALTNIEHRLYVDANCRAEFIRLVQQQGSVRNFESQVYRKDGSVIWISENACVLYNANGQILGYEGTVEDITGRKRAEEELERSLSLLQATLESTADGILVADVQGKMVSFNRKFAQMWQLPQSIIESQDDLQTSIFVLDQLKDPEGFLTKTKELSRQQDAESYDILELRDERIFERYSQLQQIGGRRVGRVWSFRDITARKLAEERLRYDALHDTLTGLPNRTLFMDQLERALEQIKQCEDNLFAVLFIDLDRFKVVNDSLGHVVGDQLLIAIARRLEACLHPSDTVARLGGDEFTILLTNIQDLSDVIEVVNQIQAKLALPFTLSMHEVFATASIGITLGATGYERPEDLLRDTDTAMYRAKALGKACYEVFDPTMYTGAVTRLQLENDLWRAIERQEFQIHYQPIVSFKSLEIVGFEALVRWQHPSRGLVSPAEFIPIAEETGLIIPIGQWVLREACRQMHEWQGQLPDSIPLFISVNLSSKQLYQPDLLLQIKQILQATHLEAHSLKLEITESVLMENTEFATATLMQLKNLGVHLCLDDFGTGYSSLSYLHSFPIDVLKIDRSFINCIGLDDENSRILIVQTILALARNLHIDVVAEGVETPRQLAQLKMLGCPYGQGYFFSRPVEPEAAAALVAQDRIHGGGILQPSSNSVLPESCYPKLEVI